MKRKTILSAIFALLFAICGLFGACDANDKENSSSEQTEVVYTLSADDISLLVGAEYKPDCSLKADGKRVDGATFTYRSLNTEFVSVAGEKLKAEKVGTATIEISASVVGKQVAQSTFSCKVNENKAPYLYCDVNTNSGNQDCGNNKPRECQYTLLTLKKIHSVKQP